ERVAEGRQLGGPHLDRVVVAGHGRDLLFVHPRRRVHGHAGERIQIERAPVLLVVIARHVAGADQQQVAALHGDVRGGGGGLEIGGGDRVTRLERAHALVPGDVEQDTPPGDLVARLVDAVLGGAAAGDQRRVVAVVHLSFVEDVV